MGLLDVCSYNSYWRGLDYFENKRVKSLKQINRYEFEADVEGTETYHVHLDIAHALALTPRVNQRYVNIKLLSIFLLSLKKLKKQLMKEIVITRN